MSDDEKAHPGDLWTLSQRTMSSLADSERRHRDACHLMIVAGESGDIETVKRALTTARFMLGRFARYVGSK